MRITLAKTLVAISLFTVANITWADAVMLCPGSEKPSPLSITGNYKYFHTPFEWNGIAPDGWQVTQQLTPGGITTQAKTGTYYFWTAFYTPASPQTNKPSKIDCFYVTPEDDAANYYLTLTKTNVVPFKRSDPKDQWTSKTQDKSSLDTCGCSSGICVQTLNCPFISSPMNDQ